MGFGDILQRVIQAHPSVQGVLFCDEEGELVDLARAPGSTQDLYELKVLAATGAAWLRTATRVGGGRSEGVRQRLLHQRARVLLHGLPDHYYLLALVDGTAPSAVVERSLQRAARETRAEM
jgi:hypothetical protein